MMKFCFILSVTEFLTGFLTFFLTEKKGLSTEDAQDNYPSAASLLTVYLEITFASLFHCLMSVRLLLFYTYTKNNLVWRQAFSAPQMQTFSKSRITQRRKHKKGDNNMENFKKGQFIPLKVTVGTD